MPLDVAVASKSLTSTLHYLERGTERPARYRIEPPPGVPLRDVFQSQGFIDHYTPPPCIEALGVALGGSPIGPLLEPLDGFALAGRPPLEAPVTKNLGERTVVFHQYPAAAGSDGHFVDFDDPDARRQSVDFLATLAAEGVATLVP